MMTSTLISRSVFINCPFDTDYLPLFHAIVFSLEYCGFGARSALEVTDSGETRIGKIIQIIRESRYGIHDLSRTDLNPLNLPRFNMPFELGLFLGMKAAGGKYKDKMALVFDSARFRYQQFLSDLAGHDIHAHNGETQNVISTIRDWLSQFEIDIPGREHVVSRYGQFLLDIPSLLKGMKKSEKDMDNFPDYHGLVRFWIANNTK